MLTLCVCIPLSSTGFTQLLVMQVDRYCRPYCQSRLVSVQCSALRCSVTVYCIPVECIALQYSAMHSGAVLQCTSYQYSTQHCSTVQCISVHQCVVQYRIRILLLPPHFLLCLLFFGANMYDACSIVLHTLEIYRYILNFTCCFQ